MSRSPLSYPLTRAADGEAGGIADLQTDVMRFMAILAICLVAIFALVQSIPLNSVPVEPVPDPVPDIAAELAPEPVSEPRPEPVTEPLPEPEPLPAPAPPTPAAVTEAEPLQTPAPAVPTQQEGFTLQFENDLALTRLVARNEIGLYAIGAGESLRMNVNRGRFSFWPAATPNEFHEMDPSTVPDDVASALRRMHDDPAVRWGVTLPAGMQQQLDQFMQTGRNGAIYIAANGQLRLET